jgi:hypothetical protein
MGLDQSFRLYRKGYIEDFFEIASFENYRFLHNWIEEQVVNNENTYPFKQGRLVLSKTILKTLFKVLKKVLKDNSLALELLSIRRFDESYFEEVARLRDLIKKILILTDFKTYEIVYNCW